MRAPKFGEWWSEIGLPGAVMIAMLVSGWVLLNWTHHQGSQPAAQPPQDGQPRSLLHSDA